jgi:DNA-binding NarL/FixJ family response regulator
MTEFGQNKANKQTVAFNKSGPIQILLADDHSLMRRALVDLLHGQKDLRVVAQASTGREAVKKATECKPHVVLMDVSMPDMNGIDATAQIRNKLPDTRIIGLSLNNDSYTRGKMFNAGANAYLDKAELFDKLVHIIKTISSG